MDGALSAQALCWMNGTQAGPVPLFNMDLLHKLDEPDRSWFAPLIWAGAYTAIAVLVLAYFLDAFV
jgi:hypothetical protein